MRCFQSILMYDDGREQDNAALNRAAQLAKENDASLTVLGSVETLRREVPAAGSLDAGKMRDLMYQERMDRLIHLISPLRYQGINVTPKAAAGTPFLEIVREVLRNRHDLVILNAEEGGGLSRVLVGSTAMHLMRKCPVPVWVTKSRESSPYRRILAAVDPDPDEEESLALSSKILELALSLAHREGGQLHIVHAWCLPAERILRGSAHVKAEEVDLLVEEMRAMHETRLNRLVAKYPVNEVDHRVHLVKAPAQKAISDVARNESVDLIVMGTVCRTGVAGMLIGNTAEWVLQDVDRSILTVKPDGFETPVLLD